MTIAILIDFLLLTNDQLHYKSPKQSYIRVTSSWAIFDFNAIILDKKIENIIDLTRFRNYNLTESRLAH